MIPQQYIIRYIFTYYDILYVIQYIEPILYRPTISCTILIQGDSTFMLQPFYHVNIQNIEQYMWEILLEIKPRTSCRRVRVGTYLWFNAKYSWIIISNDSKKKPNRIHIKIVEYNKKFVNSKIYNMILKKKITF